MTTTPPWSPQPAPRPVQPMKPDTRHLGFAEQLFARDIAKLAITIAEAPQNQGAEAGANTTLAIRHLAEAQALIIANARMSNSGTDAQGIVHAMRAELGIPG